MARRKFNPTLDTLARFVLNNKRYTRHLIHAVLGLNVKDLEILDGKQFRRTENDLGESGIFYTEVDVLAKLDNGSQVIIEIQVAKQKAFLKRLLTYSAEQMVDNFEKARESANSTHSAYSFVQPVYIVSILSENFFKDDVPFHDYTLKDKNSETPFEDVAGQELVRYAFLELKKYDANKLSGALKQWFQYWANLDFDEDTDTIILDADSLLDESKWNSEEKKMISTDVKRIEDYKASLEQAIEDRTIQDAINFLKLNTPPEIVAKALNFSLDFVKELQEENGLTHA